MYIAGGLLGESVRGLPALGTSSRDEGICPALYGPSAAVLPVMKPVITIWPDELAWNTPVSPKTQRAFPLGSATLSPSSPEMAWEGFSQTDSTGPDALCVVGPAAAPLAAAGEIEAARVAGVARRAPRAKATRARNRRRTWITA
jgi:hypothetical protein